MSNEAEILRALDLGTSKEILNNKGSSPLSKLLVSLCDDVVDQLKQALANRNINTSSLGLSQSIHVSDVGFDNQGVYVSLSAEFYWKYVNYGVNGTEVNHGAPNWGSSLEGDQSFFQAVKDWIPKRGLQLPPEFNSFESFTYAIMTNIRKHGKEARPFFEDVVNEQLIQTMRKPIEDVIGRAIELTIISPFKTSV